MWATAEIEAINTLFSGRSWLIGSFLGGQQGNKWIFFIFFYSVAALFAVGYQLLLTYYVASIKRLFSNSLLFSCALIAFAIPVIGSIGIVFFTNVLLFFPISKSFSDNYELLDDSLLESYNASVSASSSLYEYKNIDLVNLIYGNLSQHDSNFILNIVNHLPWSPHKTRILQMMLEYSRYPLIIVKAAGLLAQKKNDLFNTISELEKKSDEYNFSLSCNYHEVYYLSLVDAQVGKFYLDSACLYIEKTLHTNDEYLDTYNLAARFCLENKQLEKAEQYIAKAINIMMSMHEEKQHEQLINTNYAFFESNLLEIDQLRRRKKFQFELHGYAI